MPSAKRSTWTAASLERFEGTDYKLVDELADERYCIGVDVLVLWSAAQLRLKLRLRCVIRRFRKRSSLSDVLMALLAAITVAKRIRLSRRSTHLRRSVTRRLSCLTLAQLLVKWLIKEGQHMVIRT